MRAFVFAMDLEESAPAALARAVLTGRPRVGFEYMHKFDIALQGGEPSELSSKCSDVGDPALELELEIDSPDVEGEGDAEVAGDGAGVSTSIWISSSSTSHSVSTSGARGAGVGGE
jgi:hypothetical protein